MPNLSSLRIVLCLWLAGLCAAAQFAKFGLFLPELQRLYPDAGAELGFLVSLVSVVGALLGLFAGALTGRVGLRKVLLAGLTLGSVLSLVQALHLPMSVLLATRILEGVSHLAIVVSAPTLMALHSSERLRASAMTLWGTFFGVSFAITAWFGLPLVATHGIQALLLVHGLLIGTTALLVRSCCWCLSRVPLMFGLRVL